MDAARAKPPLGDLEASAFTQQDVGGGHAHVLEQHLAMAVRCIVIAEHRQHPLHGHALGIARHQDHGLLLVAVRVVRVGLAHQDQHLAARIADAGGPPLATVDDIFVAVTLDAAGDVGGVGGGNLRLRHREGGADLAIQQRLQPLLLMLLGAVTGQHFHVAGVGRGAVEDLRGVARTAHDLAQRRIVQVGHGETIGILRQEQVPKPLGLGDRLQFLGLLDRLPAIALGELVIHELFVRQDVLVHERLNAFGQIT